VTRFLEDIQNLLQLTCDIVDHGVAVIVRIGDDQADRHHLPNKHIIFIITIIISIIIIAVITIIVPSILAYI
jgi:hypothetical protein